MKSLFAATLAIPQIIGTVYLTQAEGWVSGAVFFVFWAVFTGLVAGVGDLVNRLFRRKEG
jgi:hypothetical protein